MVNENLNVVMTKLIGEEMAKLIGIGLIQVMTDEEMTNLIEKGLVQVRVYEDDGHIPPKPFVELQTDLEKTNKDYCNYIGTFLTLDEAENVAQAIGDHLKIPYKLVKQ